MSTLDAKAEMEPPEPLPLAPARAETPPPPLLPAPVLSAIVPVEPADKPVRSDMPPELSALSAETIETSPLFDTADAPLRNVAVTPLSSRPS